MEDIDRRKLLIASGAVLALAGCQKKPEKPEKLESAAGRQKGQEAAAPNGAVSMKRFEDSWNQGSSPWLPHPTPGAPFDPTYIAILHLELKAIKNALNEYELKFIVNRVLIPRDPKTNNDLTGNIVGIAKAIEYMNGPIGTPPFPSMKIFPGLDGYSFKGPAHCIIYVKNRGVEYHETRPVWFGKKLRDKVTDAAPNESFFGAKRFDAKVDHRIIIANGSQKFIYMKNYFHKCAGDPCKYETITGDLKYDLNINALIRTTDGIDVPLIIDPDTGNMGTGPGDAAPL
ncbi:MAG: hypothetical protein V4574_13585 [Pseudomonadota bacterium]